MDIITYIAIAMLVYVDDIILCDVTDTRFNYVAAAVISIFWPIFLVAVVVGGTIRYMVADKDENESQ